MAGHVSIFQREKHLSMDTLTRILQLPKGTADQNRGIEPKHGDSTSRTAGFLSSKTHTKTSSGSGGHLHAHNLEGKFQPFLGGGLISGVDFHKIFISQIWVCLKMLG